jgi:hypothetical protein
MKIGLQDTTDTTTPEWLDSQLRDFAEIQTLINNYASIRRMREGKTAVDHGTTKLRREWLRAIHAEDKNGPRYDIILKFVREALDGFDREDLHR